MRLGGGGVITYMLHCVQSGTVVISLVLALACLFWAKSDKVQTNVERFRLESFTKDDDINQRKFRGRNFRVTDF